MDFNNEQKEVINYGKGNLLVEAGPGSGKTTVIVARIKHLINECNVSPESFLVITFTRKAAENLQFKLRKDLGKGIVDKMQISTIHSFCLEFLKNTNKIINLLDDDSQERKLLFLQKYKNYLGFTGVNVIKNYQLSSVADKFEEYTNFKVDSEKLITHVENEYPLSPEYMDFVSENNYFSNKKIREEGLSDDWYNARFQQVARAYPRYMELLDKNSLVDYSTLQLKTLQYLQSNPKTPYTTVLIDEFQDTDPLQYEIFKILLENAEYFTAVGDIDQRIYSFRSTFKDYFDEMEKITDAARVSLNCNYRSTESIVNFTDNFIKHQRSSKSKKHLKANNREYDNPVFVMETELPKKRNFQKQAYEAEAQKILDVIRELNDEKQVAYSDIAVLYRKHNSRTVKYLVDKLKEAGIPFSIKGGSDLKDKKEVKAVILMLWYITRRLDKSYISSKDEYDWLSLKGFCDENLEGAFWQLADETKQYLQKIQQSFEDEVTEIRNKISPPKRGGPKKFSTTAGEDEAVLIEIYENVEKPVIDLNCISDENDREFFKTLESLRDKFKSEDAPEILKAYYLLLSMSDYFDDITKNPSQVENLSMLTQTMSNYEEYISQTDIRGLYFFLAQVIRNYSANYDEPNGVQLMTVHAAKGLEFPVTIVSSLQKDEFPMKVKDETRSKKTIMMKDTFYTPNECLEYKHFTDETGEYRPITVEEENQRELEEEERVIYVAMTRAADLLILSCIGDVPECIENLYPCLTPFTLDVLDNVKICRHFEKEDTEQLILNYSKYTKYCSCPFKYNLGYNLGFSRPGAKAANRGTVFHEIMETVNLKLIDGEKISKNELSGIIQKAYSSMFNIHENPEEYEEFKKNTMEYYEKYSIKREVMEAELDFEIDRGEYLLNGAIDLIYKTGDKELVILDYKYAEYDEDHIDGYIKQSHLYAAAVKELSEFKDYRIKEAIIHFVLSDYQHVVEINDDEINEELERLDDVAYKINHAHDFSKDSKDCETCSYRIFCKPDEFKGELNV